MKDDFIGSNFFTSKGGILTVIEHNGLTRNKKKYLTLCSICSQDNEMYPDPFSSPKSSLNKGYIPCGCSSNQLSERQQWVKVTRHASYLGVTVGKWEDYSKGGFTKLTFSCSNGHKYCNRVFNFLKLTYCPECYSSRLGVPLTLKTDEDITKDYLSKGGVAGSECKRLSSDKNRVVVSCPVCKVDEYAVMCGSVTNFESSISSVSNGCKPCRCSNNSLWNRKERELQVSLLEVSRGVKFLNWVGNYTNNKSKLSYLCKEGHFNTRPLNAFLFTDSCVQCAKSGFDSSKGAWLYLYRWEGSKEAYLKFGITNRKDISKRIDQQKRKSSLLPTEICKVWDDSGMKIQDTERFLKKYFKHSRGVCPRELFQDGFSETIADTLDNELLVTNLIKGF